MCKLLIPGERTGMGSDLESPNTMISEGPRTRKELFEFAERAQAEAAALRQRSADTLAATEKLLAQAAALPTDRVTALREELAGLRQALVTRAVIEQAKGVLMATVGCTPDEAFELLRRQSQHENRKVREIAEELVAAQHRAGRS